MNKKLGNILKFIVFLGVGLFFVYWFLIKLDSETKQSIWQSIIGANYWWVTFAIFINTMALFIRALRWQLLYEPLQQVPRLKSTFGAVLVAYLANLAFPRLGEVLRCAVLSTSDDIPIEKSFGTMITERFIDVAAYFVIILLGFLFMFNDMLSWFGDGFSDKFHSMQNLAFYAIILLVIGIGCIWAYIKLRKKLTKNFLFAKIDNLIIGCIDGIKSIFQLRKRSIILFIIYSVLIYLCYILGGLVIFQAFPETYGLGFKAAFVVYLFGSVGMVISQGGIGVYPTLVQKALALYGVSLAVGNACGWLLWSSQQALIIVLGLGFMLYFATQKKKKLISNNQ